MMQLDKILSWFDQYTAVVLNAIFSPYTYIQLAVLFSIYVFAFFVALKLRKSVHFLHDAPNSSAHPFRKLSFHIGGIIFPLLALFLLKVSANMGVSMQYSPWLIQTALSIAILLFFNSLITIFVSNNLAATLFRWIGLPLLFLHLIDILPAFIATLESMSIKLGNVSISAYGVLRVMIFGGFLFWLGRISNVFGKAIIHRQESIDVPTKEVFSKLFEVTVFCVIVLLLLNIMGINLTTLAVFGGAVGVGLGLGLQSIASNFISGIIILLDRSLTIGDYVELDDGHKGFVREFKMRYTVVETYDGKDILVPNETFISSLLINWTHKDPKQRYRVDFSIPYAADTRHVVELIKAAAAEHPQILSGEDIPLEDRPDCEIDSFGDSGVNMFVEFWMHGIDDGKNRVGGDLLLIIIETLKANNIDIPFPQREVRILKDD